MSFSQQTSPVPNYLFFGLLLLITTTNMRLVSSSPIVLYEDVHFKGKRSRFHIGESTCVNLIGKLNGFHSSVDTSGTCLLLCPHHNCRGKCEAVRGRLEDFSNINLNDRVSSIRKCRSPHEDKNKDPFSPSETYVNVSSQVSTAQPLPISSTPKTILVLRRKRRRKVIREEPISTQIQGNNRMGEETAAAVHKHNLRLAMAG